MWDTEQILLRALLSSHISILKSKQALRNSCELLRQRKELHARSWNCMQAHGTACKLRELHESSWTCMQAHVTACKLIL